MTAVNKISTTYWPPPTRFLPYIWRLPHDFYHILTTFNKLKIMSDAANEKVKTISTLINKYLIEETPLCVSTERFIIIVIVWILNAHFLNSNIPVSSIKKLLAITNVVQKTIFVISSDLVSLHICRWPCLTNLINFVWLFSGRKIDFISMLFWDPI